MNEFVGKVSVWPAVEMRVDVDDHLGKSNVHVHKWGNGEGFTVYITDVDEDGRLGKEQSIEITESQFAAIKKCLNAATGKTL